MGEASSSSSFIPIAALSLYPLGPSGIPLIPCPECGDKVVECKSWKINGKIFFKCVNYDEFAVKKCPFFRWIDAYKKVVAKKIKEDMEKKRKEEMQSAVAYEGHGETKALVEMKPNCRIYEEERMDLKAPPTGEDDATAVATCKICLDQVPPSHLHHASRGCAHAFCTVCLSDYISAKSQGGRISDVKCPGDGEGCCNVLDPELCRAIIPGEAFEALCAALCKSMVEGAGNFCYCPFNDCSEILVDDRGGDVPESECPACRRLFCARCRVPWHAGISCAEYGQLAPGDKGKEDLVVLEMAKGEKWKRCPNCKFLVDKRDGCVHMTCR